MKQERRSKNKKERILQHALFLFNRSGTSHVSTNHICQAASVSPGNLYYHYKNKEEIIVALFQQMIEQWDRSPLPQKISMDTLPEMYERMFLFLWEYRFIHREINSLYREIPAFRATFKEAQKKRMSEIASFVSIGVESGLFRPMNDEEVSSLVRKIWFFSLYWMAYLETEGAKVTLESARSSLTVVMSMIEPYLAAEFK